MEYMILIHSDENSATPRPGTAGFEQMMASWMAYNQRLIDGGHWIAAANLQPTGTATTDPQILRFTAHRHRWAVRRDEGTARRFLSDQGR